MAYLSNIRIDQKCGNSGIAKGKKCRKGAGSKGNPLDAGRNFKQGNIGEKILIGGGAAAGIGGVAAGLTQLVRGNVKGAHKAYAVAHGGFATLGAGTTAQGVRQGDKRKQRWGAVYTGANAVLSGANASIGTARSRKDPREVGAQAWRNMRSRAEAQAKEMGRVEKVTVREIPNSTKALPPARSKKRKDSIDFSSGLTASLFL